MVRVQRRRREVLLLTRKEIQICFVFLAVFLSRVVQGEEINCQDLKRLTAQESLTVPMPSSSQSDSSPTPMRLWYEPDASDQAKLELKFGKYEFALENAKRSWKLSFKVSKRKVMESRVYYEWIKPQGWARITLRSSRRGYGVEIGADQMLDIHLGELEMDTIDSIEISGASVSISTTCISTKERQSVAATTLPPTQTTTIATTTTTEPTTTEDTTTLSPDYETTVEEVIDTNNSTSNPDLDIVVPFASKKALDGHECTNLPIWVWVCLSVMVAFFASSLILFACVVVLYRRNKSLLASSGNERKQGDVLPGGYGQQSKDLQFIKPGNDDSSIVAIAPPQPSWVSYTQTLDVPSGNQMAPNVRFSTGPRPCEYKRSTSCPEKSPSISFPPPPATPPPERDETVPLYSPDGSVENNRTSSTSSGRGRHSARTSSTRRKRRVQKGFDADDESSSDN